MRHLKKFEELAQTSYIDVYAGINKDRHDWKEVVEILMKYSIDGINFNEHPDSKDTYSVNIRINNEDLSDVEDLVDYIETKEINEKLD